MNARIITYDEMRNDVSGVVKEVYTGGTVLLQEANKPVAAIISFEDYLALRDQLEERHSSKVTDEEWGKVAQEVLDEHDEAWR